MASWLRQQAACYDQAEATGTSGTSTLMKTVTQCLKGNVVINSKVVAWLHYFSHTVHTLPILNFQPADPTCGQAMCGVELVAPTPLVAALTERLLGLRCQVMQHSSSGLGSHQNPSSS